MESDYVKRIEQLSSLNPSLKRVLQYINRPPTHGLPDHAQLRAVFIEHTNQGTRSSVLRVFEGAQSSLEQLGRAIRAASPAYKTVIVQDIQPNTMLYLGVLLNINPACFEHYLNRDASFETFDPSVLVFDYPETFLSTHTALKPDFLRRSKVHTRGTLIKVWMNLYTYFQRVVSAKISRPSPQSDIHLLLVDSLPDFGPLKYHLAEKSSTMWDKLGSESAWFEALAYLQNLITQSDRGIPRQEPVANAVIDYVSSKWQTLLYYAQVKISESQAPLTGDLQLIAEVIQRKHDFEKMQRIMMANLRSARSLPGIQPENQRLADLHAYQVIIAGWASQLEKVASSLQGLLAISESLKASQQAFRTQNLTILAFVFIPVSTVSSIYGMNTAEIAQNNPHMWQFGVSACATTLVAIFAAWSYQYWFTFPRFIKSSMHVSSRKRKATVVQSVPVGPTRPPFGAVDRGIRANIHTQPLKVSRTAVSQDIPIIATRADVQTHSTAKPLHLNFRQDGSDVENGRLSHEGGGYTFRISERNTAPTTGSACTVM